MWCWAKIYGCVLALQLDNNNHSESEENDEEKDGKKFAQKNSFNII